MRISQSIIGTADLSNGGMLEAIAEDFDKIDIRIQPSVVKGEQMLYIDLNGVTLVRIGKIKQEIEITRE